LLASGLDSPSERLGFGTLLLHLLDNVREREVSSVTRTAFSSEMLFLFNSTISSSTRALMMLNSFTVTIGSYLPFVQRLVMLSVVRGTEFNSFAATPQRDFLNAGYSAVGRTGPQVLPG